MTKPKPKELHKKAGRPKKTEAKTPEIPDFPPAMPEIQPKNKRGRPLKLSADEKTVEQVKQLALIHCSEEEAAAVLGVVKQTFLDFLEREPEVKAYWDEGQANGRATLRRAAFAKAVRGQNPEMLKFLMKNLMGMSDKTTVESSGPNGGPIQVNTVTLTEADKKAILDILE